MSQSMRLVIQDKNLKTLSDDNIYHLIKPTKRVIESYGKSVFFGRLTFGSSDDYHDDDRDTCIKPITAMSLALNTATPSDTFSKRIRFIDRYPEKSTIIEMVAVIENKTTKDMVIREASVAGIGRVVFSDSEGNLTQYTIPPGGTVRAHWHYHHHTHLTSLKMSAVGHGEFKGADIEFTSHIGVNKPNLSIIANGIEKNLTFHPLFDIPEYIHSSLYGNYYANSHPIPFYRGVIVDSGLGWIEVEVTVTIDSSFNKAIVLNGFIARNAATGLDVFICFNKTIPLAKGSSSRFKFRYSWTEKQPLPAAELIPLKLEYKDKVTGELYVENLTRVSSDGYAIGKYDFKDNPITLVSEGLPKSTLNILGQGAKLTITNGDIIQNKDSGLMRIVDYGNGENELTVLRDQIKVFQPMKVIFNNTMVPHPGPEKTPTVRIVDDTIIEVVSDNIVIGLKVGETEIINLLGSYYKQITPVKVLPPPVVKVVTKDVYFQGDLVEIGYTITPKDAPVNTAVVTLSPELIKVKPWVAYVDTNAKGNGEIDVTVNDVWSGKKTITIKQRKVSLSIVSPIYGGETSPITVTVDPPFEKRSVEFTNVTGLDFKTDDLENMSVTAKDNYDIANEVMMSLGRMDSPAIHVATTTVVVGPKIKGDLAAPTNTFIEDGWFDVKLIGVPHGVFIEQIITTDDPMAMIDGFSILPSKLGVIEITLTAKTKLATYTYNALVIVEHFVVNIIADKKVVHIDEMAKVSYTTEHPEVVITEDTPYASRPEVMEVSKVSTGKYEVMAKRPQDSDVTIMLNQRYNATELFEGFDMDILTPETLYPNTEVPVDFELETQEGVYPEGKIPFSTDAIKGMGDRVAMLYHTPPVGLDETIFLDSVIVLDNTGKEVKRGLVNVDGSTEFSYLYGKLTIIDNKAIRYSISIDETYSGNYNEVLNYRFDYIDLDGKRTVSKILTFALLAFKP